MKNADVILTFVTTVAFFNASKYSNSFILLEQRYCGVSQCAMVLRHSSFSCHIANTTANNYSKRKVKETKKELKEQGKVGEKDKIKT